MTTTNAPNAAPSSTTVSRLDSNRRLGSYQLLATIAVGESCTIYRARSLVNRAAKSDVVIKRLRPAQQNGYARAGLLREAQAGLGLRAPNLVRVLEVHDGPAPYIVMEYVAGASVRELLARANAADFERYVVPIFLDVLRGLSVLHSRKDDAGEPAYLVHQAPLARHMLVGTDGVTRLLDLSTVHGRLLGSAPNIANGIARAVHAPEQIAGRARLDPRCDIFILGATLREVLVRAGDAQPLTASVRARLASLTDVCARASAPRRSDRFWCAEEMAYALRTVAAEAELFTEPEEIGAWVRTTLGGQPKPAARPALSIPPPPPARALAAAPVAAEAPAPPGADMLGTGSDGWIFVAADVPRPSAPDMLGTGSDEWIWGAGSLRAALPPGPSASQEQALARSTPASQSETSPSPSSPAGLSESSSRRRVPAGVSESSSRPSLPVGLSESSSRRPVPSGVSESSSRRAVSAGVSESSSRRAVPAGVSESSSRRAVPASVSESSGRPSVPASSSPPGARLSSTPPRLPANAGASNLRPSLPASARVNGTGASMPARASVDSMGPSLPASARVNSMGPSLPASARVNGTGPSLPASARVNGTGPSLPARVSSPLPSWPAGASVDSTRPSSPESAHGSSPSIVDDGSLGATALMPHRRRSMIALGAGGLVVLATVFSLGAHSAARAPRASVSRIGVEKPPALPRERVGAPVVEQQPSPSLVATPAMPTSPSLPPSLGAQEHACVVSAPAPARSRPKSNVQLASRSPVPSARVEDWTDMRESQFYEQPYSFQAGPDYPFHSLPENPY